MRQEEDLPRRRLSSAARRIVVRFAEIVCPPEVRSGGLAGQVLAEFESLLDVVPAAVRSSARGGLVAFDQGARLYPRARGRRFVHLPDDAADAYYRAVLARRGAGLALQRIKGLVVMCYYELPEVKEQLGYRPDAYIAAVSRRRLESYGAQIRAGEAAVLAPGPGDLDRGPREPDRGPGDPGRGHGEPDRGHGEPDRGHGEPDRGHGEPDRGTPRNPPEGHP